MDEVANMIARQKISAAMAGQEEYECFVDGPAVGMGEHPIPCLLDTVAGQTAKIVLADGHDTGAEITVPLSSIAIISGDKMAESAKKLFRGDL